MSRGGLRGKMALFPQESVVELIYLKAWNSPFISLSNWRTPETTPRLVIKTDSSKAWDKVRQPQGKCKEFPERASLCLVCSRWAVLPVTSQLHCLQSVSFLLFRGKPDSAQIYRMPISVTTEKPKAIIIQVTVWIVINSEFTIQS